MDKKAEKLIVVTTIIQKTRVDYRIACLTSGEITATWNEESSHTYSNKDKNLEEPEPERSN